MRTIAILNLKGGSGKTTTAINLAVGLARLLSPKKRLLLLDADAQANATMTILDGHAAAAPTLGQVLLEPKLISEAIRPTRIPNLDVLPAAGNLANCTIQLAGEYAREERLRKALEFVGCDYETCVIDSPPSMSLISVNILRATSDVIVPVDSGIYAIAGMGRLNDTIETIKKNFDHDALKVIGLVLTKAQKNAVSQSLETQLREIFPGLVFDTVIPYDPKVEESAVRHRAVLEFAPSSRAAKAFSELIEEVLKHGRQKHGVGRSDAKYAGTVGRGKKRRAG